MLQVVVVGKIYLIQSCSIFKFILASGPSDNEETNKVDELLKDAEIVDKFAEMVCIRLENGTPTCGQFAAIYPVILIPSIYFIGDP